MHSLEKRYAVSALGWDRDGVSDEMIAADPSKIKFFKLRTSFWKPTLIRMFMRLLIFFPLFWLWIVLELLKTNPRVVHACDLDTAIPCYIYKKICRKKIVFDIFDRYAMVFIPTKYRTFYKIVNSLEERIIRKSNAVIVAGGEKIIDTFKIVPPDCVAILNCPEDYQNFSSTSSIRENGDRFKVAYTGGIRRGRGLETISKILGNIIDADFVLAGPVMEQMILKAASNFPNVRYEGNLIPSEAIELELKCDVIIALYDPELPWNMITLPNKLFEAMMCGVPIITNVAIDIVKETRCGIIVEYDDIEQIRQAIITLRDNPKLRKELGDNGRKAFLQKYNWTAMERKLFHIYEELI
jgi:glycosyltransferase involved in cell wall biosynthesis